MIEVWELFDDRTGQVWESSRGTCYLVVSAPKWNVEAPDQAMHDALELETGKTCSLLETVDEPWEDARGARRIA